MAVMPRENTEVDSALTRIEMQLDQHSANFARVEADIRELRSEIRVMNRTLVAGFFAVFAAIVGTNVFF